jgi:hypothetical protein
MSRDESPSMKMDGESEKPFKLYRTYKGETVGKAIAEADTEDEIRDFLKRNLRQDWFYAILHNRKRI